jgi:branched-chain amino acid transport system permease protein
MTLLIASVISGIAVGLLYGLLAFSIVFLYKTTGVANFAMGNMATFAAFVVFHLLGPLGGGAMVAGLAGAALLGLAIYGLALRLNDRAGLLNAVMRTLAIYLFLAALMNRFWAEGQPFTFPSLLPKGSFELGGVTVAWASLAILGIAGLLSLCFVLLFTRTSLGVQFLGLAERPDVARLLGVRTRRLSALAWMISGVIAMVVGVLVAPMALLSSDMMEHFLLFAFTAAIVGGLNSLSGAFVGGIVVGCVSNISIVYLGQDAALFAVFLLLVGVLLARPDGLFGTAVVHRL